MTADSASQKLSSPMKTLEIVRQNDFTFLKKLGQNFLIDEHVIRGIVDAADVSGEDCVVEIGPGIGTLTQYLAEAAGHVIAIEIDRMLIPILEDTLSGYNNVTVINQDILKTDLQEISERFNEGRPLKIVANLPYYITTPILMQLLESRVKMSSLTVMVQKEVAVRMSAGPGSKEYGALSLAVQYYTKPQIALEVPPGCFMPRPKVTSAVVHMDCEGMPSVPVKDEKLMFKIIRAAFNQRRKTLANALKNSTEFSWPREEILGVLEMAGLDARIRGEALSLSEFARLADLLGDK